MRSARSTPRPRRSRTRPSASSRARRCPALKALATDEEAGVKAELDTELRGIASAAGVTEEQLKAKITEQQQAVKDEAAAVEKGLAASSATASKQTEQRKQDADAKAAGARDNADAETKAKEEALQGPPDTAAIEKKRDEYITKVQDVGAQALAGYTSSLNKRESDLDQAATTQKAAVKQAADNQAAAIRRHWADDPSPDKAALEALPTTDWGRSPQRPGRRRGPEAQDRVEDREGGVRRRRRVHPHLVQGRDPRLGGRPAGHRAVVVGPAHGHDHRLARRSRRRTPRPGRSSATPTRATR